jgi:3-dehydroquinate dehydratase/shikimate dehydrogenase
MTQLVASLFVRETASLEAMAKRAWASGADMIELRLDEFRDDPARLAEWLASIPDRRFILTCRSKREGGLCESDALTRAELLSAAAAGNGAMIDFELADWRLHADTRGRLTCVADRRGDAADSFPWLILSRHNVHGPAERNEEVVEFLSDLVPGAVGKIAHQSRHINDTFAMLDAMHEHRNAVIAIAMGDDGLWTRVLAKKLGAFATFAALDELTSTAPGQLSVEEMIVLYRWREITERTKVYGVIGDPVGHSMSPTLFNHWFRQSGIDAVYLPLLVRSKRGCVRQFLDECRLRKWLDIGGLSVTVPHKSAVLAWAGEAADRAARNIGAVNTLVFHGDGFSAHNTDCNAAVSSLADALGCQPPDLFGVSVDVLGIGGAARALLYGLPMTGCRVTVYGRSADRTRRLAEQFSVTPAAWEDRARRSGEVVINATSVGMWPTVEESPLPADALENCRMVFDLIYNPAETRLLRDAGLAGAATLNGLDMFIRQAAMQFALWTGREPSTDGVGALLVKALSRRNKPQKAEDASS